MKRVWLNGFFLLVGWLLSACGGSSAFSGSSGDEAEETPSDLITYTPATNLSNSVASTLDRTFTIASDGTIHIFWFEAAEIYYSRSIDNGANFDPPRVIVARSTGHMYRYLRAAHTPNAIHLTWTVYDLTTGSAEIFHMRSTDDGGSFENWQLVSLDDGFNSYASSISADTGGRVAIAWNNETAIPVRPKFAISADEGANFGVASFFDTNSGSSPSLLLAPPMFYASWADNEFYSETEIFLSSSVDSGDNFNQPLNISQYGAKSWNGGMALGDAGEIYSTWVEGASIDNQVVRFGVSFDNGQTFTSPETLSDPDTDSPCGYVAAGTSGRIYIVWSTFDARNKPNGTYMVVSNDRGMTFSPALRMPLISNTYGCPRILANSSGQMAMLWLDAGVGPSQDSDVFYSNLNVDWP